MLILPPIKGRRQIIVYEVLKKYNNNFVSMATLKNETDMEIRSLRAALKQLVDKGYVERMCDYMSDKRSYVYRVVLL